MLFRRLILLVVIFLGFCDGVYAYDLIYVNNSDHHIYLKSNLDTSNGTAINSVNSKSPVYSSDNNFIFYVNTTDNKIYKKTATGSDNGTAITSSPVVPNNLAVSPDGLWLIYSNSNDGYKIYKKSTSDTSNGTAITSNASYYRNSYSPDGNYILYTAGGPLLRKSSNDTSNGTAITYGNTAVGGIYSKDGKNILWSNSSDSYHGYIKTSTGIDNGTLYLPYTVVGFSYAPDGINFVWVNGGDSNHLYQTTGGSLGTQITTNTALTPYFENSYTPPESCTDGIKNQDETGIDFGGVCGGSLTYSMTGTTGDYLTCTKEKVYSSSGSFYSIGFGAGFGLRQTQDQLSDLSYKIYNDFLDYSGSVIISDQSYHFSVNGVESTNSGSVIHRENLVSLLYSGSLISQIVPYGGRNTTSITIESYNSDGSKSLINYIKFKTSRVGFIGQVWGDGQSMGSLIGTGGYAVWVAPGSISDSVGRIDIKGIGGVFRFTGFEAGNVDKSYTYYSSCSNGEWSCKIGTNIDTGNVACVESYSVGNAWGSCGMSNNICQPTTSLANANYGPIERQTGTGETNNYSSTGTAIESGSGVNSIFSFSFGKLQGVGTGSCSAMFDGLKFLYGNKNASSFYLNLSNGFKLSDSPWSCAFLGTDVCGTAYNAVDFVIQKFFVAIDGTVNLVFSPVRQIFGYFSEPIPGQYYCFLGDKVLYEGKIQSYYDHLTKTTVNVGGQRTNFDYIFLFLIIIGTSIFLFR